VNHCWGKKVKKSLLLLNIFFLTFLIQSQVSAEKSITLVCSEWPGYTNADGSGLYWQLVKAVYEPLGYTVHTEITPWIRAESMVESKQADILVGDYYYPEKDGKQRLYPNWHLSVEDPIIALFKKGRHEIDDFNSLNNKTIVWMRGYDFGTIYLENIQYQYYEVDSESEGINLIQFDRYDVFLDYRSNIESILKKSDVDSSAFETEIMKLGSKLYLNFSNTNKSIGLIEIYDRRIPELLESGALERVFIDNNLSLKKFGPDRYNHSKR
jgi:polar amino acid transport system substrate-binding protein